MDTNPCMFRVALGLQTPILVNPIQKLPLEADNTFPINCISNTGFAAYPSVPVTICQIFWDYIALAGSIKIAVESDPCS